MTDNEKLREVIATFDAAQNALPDKPRAAYAVVEAARAALYAFEKAQALNNEPSDSQVVAALNAFWPDSAAPSIHSWTKDGFADDMRAALRAAGAVDV